jgi:hypothetical protein
VFATKARQANTKIGFGNFCRRLPAAGGDANVFEAAYGSWKLNLAQHRKRKKTYEARLNLT